MLGGKERGNGGQEKTEGEIRGKRKEEQRENI